VLHDLVRDLDLYIMQMTELIQSNRNQTRLKAKLAEEGGRRRRQMAKAGEKVMQLFRGRWLRMPSATLLNPNQS
jgi:hypothetical protein